MLRNMLFLQYSQLTVMPTKLFKTFLNFGGRVFCTPLSTDGSAVETVPNGTCGKDVSKNLPKKEDNSLEDDTKMKRVQLILEVESHFSIEEIFRGL